MESMPAPATGVPPSVTGTVRGVRWLVLSLGTAVLLGAVSLVALFGLAVLPVPTIRILFLLEDVVGLLALGIGLVGFVWLRRGRVERGPAHAASLQRATVALVCAVASEILILVTGLLLGFGLLPGMVVVGGTYPPQITSTWILTVVHFAGYGLVSLFVGLFLLWSIWGLVAGVARWIGLAALVLCVPTPIITLVDVAELTGPTAFPSIVYYAAWTFPAVSVALWLVAYILVSLRLRSPAAFPVAATLSP